ncbi:hypothetical protein B0H17DRAFT_1199495 [Mycena rosella]|uniref:Uncharacterized protein n=1 Tax=Mycena rosella TaxID=1033263 RepID=A0AAD7GL71_MYCRO|nr:hypothetical protein B0H17DRAFT_1199495 [Mycena rosella]
MLITADAPDSSPKADSIFDNETPGLAPDSIVIAYDVSTTSTHFGLPLDSEGDDESDCEDLPDLIDAEPSEPASPPAPASTGEGIDKIAHEAVATALALRVFVPREAQEHDLASAPAEGQPPWMNLRDIEARWANTDAMGDAAIKAAHGLREISAGFRHDSLDPDAGGIVHELRIISLLHGVRDVHCNCVDGKYSVYTRKHFHTDHQLAQFLGWPGWVLVRMFVVHSRLLVVRHVILLLTNVRFIAVAPVLAAALLACRVLLLPLFAGTALRCAILLTDQAGGFFDVLEAP